MTRQPLSIRVRLTLWSTVILTAIIAIFSMVIYTASAVGLRAGSQRKVNEAIEIVMAVIQDEVEDLEDLEEHAVVDLFSVHLQDMVVYETSDWRASSLKDMSVPDGPSVSSNRQTKDGLIYRLRAESVMAHGQTYTVAVAVDETTTEYSLQALRSVLVLGIPIALLLSLAGGYFLTGRLLSPVVGMVEQAKQINADRLNERLAVTNPTDELGQLATVFNEALGRLEDAFARLRRFASDASHELRTPLTALRSVGEVALQEDLTTTAYRDVIGSMLEEVDRLVRLVENLLTLTRGDSGKCTVTKQVMDLRKEVDEVVDNLSVLAEEKHQDILVVSKEPVLVDLDATLLRHAVLNLVDNAIKYTPPDGNIRIVVKRNEDNTAVLEVIDEGPGIPEECHEMVFERFTRIDKGRTREAGGTGLGLAIAKWAIEANGGRIELESMAGKGSTFRLIFPLHNSKAEI